MEAKIKIETNSQCHETWEKILCILSENEVKCTRLIPINGGYLAILHSENDLDLILSRECKSSFDRNNFRVMEPTRLTAKRTFILWNLDNFIKNKNEDEICENVTNANNWLKIVRVIKFSGGKHLKLICEKFEMLNRVLLEGFKLFQLYISPRVLSQDKYGTSNICYRCYSVDGHISKDCQKSVGYLVCSECSSPNHNYKNCNSSFKKCLNCKQSHSTMSFKCPSRTSNIQKSKNSSYSSVLQRSNTGNTKLDEPSREDLFRGYMSLLYATKKNQTEPGTFEETLNELLRANDLPSFSTGTVQPLLDFSCTGYQQTTSFTTERVSSNANSSSVPDQTESNISIPSNNLIPSVSNVNPTNLMRKINKKCIVYADKEKPTILGSSLNVLLKNKCISVEHFCPNESYCMNKLKNQLSEKKIPDFTMSKITSRNLQKKIDVCIPINEIAGADVFR